MRHRRRRRGKVTETDLTPMLDIVFILLIFFIVTSTFIQEQTIIVEVPNDSSSPGHPEYGILVALNAENLIRVNGRLTDISSVQAGIEQYTAENPEAGLVIQVDRASSNGHLVLIRDAAYSAGFEDKVSVMVTESEG